LHLDIAGATAIHVGQLLPDLQVPVDTLLKLLRETAPAAGPLVVAHGDLHLDQALLVDGDIALLDFDHLCLADPAHDAATVAAHLITGAPGDLDAAAVVLDAICDGLGGHPPGLAWHLAVAILRRATYPFRLVRRDWPERMRETVRVADQLASQGTLFRDTATA
jgi:aminoglycoside phosphotransferase (APT) family kinase protein